MSIDPQIAFMILAFVAVNAVATIVLAALSYVASFFALQGLQWIDGKLKSTG